MTDEERQELAELRKKLSVLENTLGRLSAQLGTIEERVGQEIPAPGEPPGASRSTAPLPRGRAWPSSTAVPIESVRSGVSFASLRAIRT